MTEDKELEKSLFQQPVWVAVFALTAAIVWGWAYPLIKLGFEELQITTDMTASKMLFAGIRFTLAGLLILALARASGKDFSIPERKSWWFIILFALFNTTLHYAFFYIGLSFSEGSRASIYNSLSTFCVVIFACILFKSDHMTLPKLIGCVFGFAGILSLNIGGGEQTSFNLMGDGMIILNAICGATASLMARGLSKRVDVFVGTGYGLAIGGALLLIPALLMGGTIPHVSLYGIILLILLIAISTIGFGLYNKLLSLNPVGKIAIYNSLIPVVGAITSCICLGEPFRINYLVAGILAAAGIYIINKNKG